MGKRSIILWLIGITALQALLLVWFKSPSLSGPDTRKYLELAVLAMNGDYWLDPTAFDGNYWPIGYPTFLSLLFQVAGSDTDMVQWVQLSLGLCLPTLTFLIARRTGIRTAIAAAFFVGINPASISMIGNGGYEILLGILITLSAAILVN